MTTALLTQQDRPVLRIERRLAHRPEKVWRALTESSQLHHWFPFDVEMEFTPDGKIRFIDKENPAEFSEGQILVFDPPHRLVYNWGGDELHWEVQPTAEGSLLIFQQAIEDRAGAASFASGWQVCLDSLELVLDDKPINPADYTGPAWKQQMDELHEFYIEQLDLRHGTAEITTEGWQVRFERQLTKPADQVWARWLGHAPTPAVGDVPPAALTTPEFPAGRVTAVDVPQRLDYNWQADGQTQGQIRWELTQGTGHGARLILIQTGPHSLTEQRFTALAAWQTQIEQFAKGLLSQRKRSGVP